MNKEIKVTLYAHASPSKVTLGDVNSDIKGLEIFVRGAFDLLINNERSNERKKIYSTAKNDLSKDIEGIKLIYKRLNDRYIELTKTIDNMALQIRAIEVPHGKLMIDNNSLIEEFEATNGELLNDLTKLKGITAQIVEKWAGKGVTITACSDDEIHDAKLRKPIDDIIIHINKKLHLGKTNFPTQDLKG